jgi:DNA-binding PucR family transcriptional regulator
LLAYLNCFGDIAAAAEQLHVHHNTLRYRLKQYEGLFGLRLERAEDRLMLWLELDAARRPH